MSSVESKGHAGKNGDFSLPCGIVSQVLVNFGQLLLENKGLCLEGAASEPGNVTLKILSLDSSQESWFEGVCDFLGKILKDLSAKFPEDVTVNIITTC